MSQRLLALANPTLACALLAALTLGRMDYLNPVIGLVEGLLVNHHQRPAGMLEEYLNAYHAAALRHLQAEGYVVQDWLARLLGQPLPAHTQQMSAGENQVLRPA